MPEIKNITNQTLHYRGTYHFLPGEPQDVPEEDVEHLLETYPERYQRVGRDRAQRGGRDRAQRGGRDRAQAEAESDPNPEGESAEETATS